MRKRLLRVVAAGEPVKGEGVGDLEVRRVEELAVVKVGERSVKKIIYGRFTEKTARLQIQKTCKADRNQTRIH
jgi:hypothetical protein